MKLSLHWKILLAIIIGGALGVAAHELIAIANGAAPEGVVRDASSVVSWLTDNLTHPVGQL